MVYHNKTMLTLTFLIQTFLGQTVYSQNTQLFQKGKELIDKKDFETAEQIFEEGLKKDPNNALAHFYYAETGAMTGKSVSIVIDRYKKVIEISPDTELAADAFVSIKRLERSEANKELQRTVDYRFSRRLVGNCYFVTGNARYTPKGDRYDAEECLCINQAIPNKDGSLLGLDILIIRKDLFEGRLMSHVDGAVYNTNFKMQPDGTFEVSFPYRKFVITRAHPNSNKENSRGEAAFDYALLSSLFRTIRFRPDGTVESSGEISDREPYAYGQKMIRRTVRPSTCNFSK